MSDQPKPTAEEWTADADEVLLPMHRFVGQYAKEIAEAHNDAIATEREEHAKALLAKQTRIEIVKQQLAAEREQGVKALAERSFELYTAAEALRQIATIEANDPDEVAAGLKQTQSYEIATAALKKVEK